MAYKEDIDLEILAHCSNDELGTLVTLLQKEARMTERLSSNAMYIKYNPNHIRYWKKIAEEIQLFGGNSFMNIMRGEGVLYKEICHDVAEKLQIPSSPHESTIQLEARIVLTLFEQAMRSMSEEERAQCIETLSQETNSQGSILGQTALQGGIHTDTIPPYQIYNIIAGAIGKQILGQGIIFMGSVALTRVIGALAGPIGWTLASLWALVDIASPAYRITIPAVAFIASFRQRIYMQQALDKDSSL